MHSVDQDEGENPESSRSDDELRFQKDFIALIPHLRAFSRLMCRNREIAQDMAQEALAKAWRSRGRFEPGSNLKAWLFTILRNEFYSYGRRAGRELEWDEELGTNIRAPSHAQEHAMALSDLVRALGALPGHQREAVILVAAGGFSYDDASKICGIRSQTLKSRVSRGRASLLKLVDGEKQLPSRSPARATEAVENVLAQLSTLSSGVARRPAHT